MESEVRMTNHQSPYRNALTDKITQRYQRPQITKSLLQVCLSSLVYLLTCVFGTYLIHTGNYLLSSILLIPTAFTIVRVFILHHDCGHNSLFINRINNLWVGRILGLMTLTPFNCWRRFHNTHHASSGNLDKRGFGDVITLTVSEYLDKSSWKRVLYRMYRHPLFLFGIGPFFLFVIRQRLTFYIPVDWKKERNSVYLTNLALVVSLLLLGWTGYLWSYLAFFLPCMALAASIGVWLFYVQHQFPNAYWRRDNEWSFIDSAMLGATYYALPWYLHWITAYIGFHHIHHLDSKIPNYRLPECYRDVEVFQTPITVSLSESIQNAKLKLWDEQQNAYVRFSDII